MNKVKCIKDYPHPSKEDEIGFFKDKIYLAIKEEKLIFSRIEKRKIDSYLIDFNNSNVGSVRFVIGQHRYLSTFDDYFELI